MTGARHVLVLPDSMKAAAVARTFVAEHADELDPEVLDDALICVSELVSNALLHGRPEIVLELRIDPPSVGVSVTDHGEEPPVLSTRRPDSTDVHGRGLQIVAALTNTWGVTRSGAATGPTKTIWFELHR